LQSQIIAGLQLRKSEQRILDHAEPLNKATGVCTIANAAGYQHVHLKEGWISICKVCFRTAAQADAEEEFAECEKGAQMRRTNTDAFPAIRIWVSPPSLTEGSQAILPSGLMRPYAARFSSMAESVIGAMEG
jgi:hypothetical protein